MVVVDDTGRFAVSLLSGHMGGANRLATTSERRGPMGQTFGGECLSPGPPPPGERQILGSRRSAMFVLAEIIEAELKRGNSAKVSELQVEGQKQVEYFSGKIDDPKLQVAFLSSKPVRILMA